jgi:hypothetical protein
VWVVCRRRELSGYDGELIRGEGFRVPYTIDYLGVFDQWVDHLSESRRFESEEDAIAKALVLGGSVWKPPGWS